jgi:TetR/AcrR family transcriptional regulator
MWSKTNKPIRKSAASMFTKFLNLDQEKQDRIINAAIKEFAQNGYDKASTNAIVKEAGISKGLLFHYFQNKKQLYMFLYEYMFQILLDKIYEKVNWDERDIFIRYREISLIKLDLFKIYPDMFNFIKSIISTESELKNELNHRGKELFDISFQKLFSDIDTSKFKKGIDIPKAISIINWTLEGFAYQMQERAAKLSLEQINQEEAIAEMEEYLEMLRNSFYE